MTKLEDAIRRAIGQADPHVRTTYRPTVSESVEVARRYIEVQMRKGTKPSKGEINGAVQRAFGPQVVLSDAEVAKARALALSPMEVDTTLTELENRVAALQADVLALQHELEEAQRQGAAALTTPTGTTVLSLIEAGCVIHIQPPPPRR